MRVRAYELIPHDIIVGPYRKGEFRGITDSTVYNGQIKYGMLFSHGENDQWGSIDGVWADEEFDIERPGMCGECNACDVWIIL